VIEETQAKSRAMKIPIYLGKDVAGNPMVVDMAAMPHLLIAGRTGTGKSVCLNSIIVSMLMTRRPDEVRMLMIDPKMVELTPYKSLPHLMHPVVTDMKKAEAILAWAVQKMEDRYALLAKVGVRHLTQYNALGREELIKRINPPSQEEADAIPTTMPFIVMIADEIADMMMTAGKEIEQHIIRLAQKSRAVGIHLILATQKPTVDVITGLIKSNLPARIAFQVASRTDSRVVLDEMGAERLLGNGDMLFLSPGTSQILRGQGTYVSDDEIGRVMAAVGTDTPQYAAELVNLQPAGAADAHATPAGSPQDKDDLYDAAVEVVIREGRGSVSLLQRALGVGYGRGARLIDFMGEDGVVGQYAGSQAREVLITMQQWADRKGEAAPPPDPAPRKLKIQPHAEAPRAGAAAPQAAPKPPRPAAARPAPALPLPGADEDEVEQDDDMESFDGDQAGGDTDDSDHDAFEAEADGADGDAFADAEGSEDEWEDDAFADGSDADDEEADDSDDTAADDHPGRS
jgi:S-DNA-T family DNA segregation ATPase FtsK/SpoIIIE